MSVKKNSEENKNNSILSKIINSLSDLKPDYFIRSESYPFYPSNAYNILEIFDESKLKEEINDEQEYKVGNYLIKGTLGKGTFGKVNLGIYIPTQEKVAIKILEKSRIVEKDDEIRVKREFEMLTLFSHPNVILVAEIFEKEGRFYSVMEYCEGGELFNYIVKNRRLLQDEAAFFYYQLINGLEYLHSLGIVHRDLKPENLLLTKDHILKIIDFGLSNYFYGEQKGLLTTPCGSPCYASPEMVAGKKYDGYKIDIWSTGIILYAMLCGYLPFEDRDNDSLFEKILECKLDFPKYIPKLGKNLIEKILVKNPNKRITISEIKKDPFYLRGKEIFNQEFTICEINDDTRELDNENYINNIMDLHILNNDDSSMEKKVDEIETNKIKKKENNKDNNKEYNKKINEKKKKLNQNKLMLNDLEDPNLIMRLNTEGEEDKQNNTLRNTYLKDLEKGINGIIEKRNNHSSKKLKKNSAKKRTNNKNIIKEKQPFTKRDIIYTKNKNKNKSINLTKEEEKKYKKVPNKNYKKLMKTNKYYNIKNKLQKHHYIGKSVNVRKLNFKINYQNKNEYTNVIKSKFNSKEKFDKNKLHKKENIYSNNINTIVQNDNLNKKLRQTFNFDFYNSIEQTHKTNNSATKKKVKLTPFQTIEKTKKNKNYLDNLFILNSNIKKFKQKLKEYKSNDIKFNGEIKIKLKNCLYNDLHDEKKTNNKSNDGNVSSVNNKKVKRNKFNIKITKIYNNKIDNKNKFINIIVNDEKEENTKNKMQQINSCINTERERVRNDINIQSQEKNNEIKITREALSKKKLLNFRYYMNEIEQTHTFRKENEKIKTHKRGINTDLLHGQDLLNSLEIKKNSNLNLNKILVNDFNPKTKRSKKGKTFIIKNIENNNINLNSIDNINKTEPNQVNHIKKKIRNINKKDIKDQNYDKINERRSNVKRKIGQKINISKNIPLNSNNFIKKQKINFNENKISQINDKIHLNRTSRDFNIINDSLNQINSKYNKVFDMNVDQNERISNNIRNNYINSNISNKKGLKVLRNADKKPCVTIKNTVINLNIDTGIIINPYDKKEKIKKISNSNIAPKHSLNDFHYSLRKYEQPNKMINYINTEKSSISNVSLPNTNENPFHTINAKKNLLTPKDNFIDVNKKLSKKLFELRNKDNIKNNNCSFNVKTLLNKSLNNHNYERHIKFKSMKLDESSK